MKEYLNSRISESATADACCLCQNMLNTVYRENAFEYSDIFLTISPSSSVNACLLTYTPQTVAFILFISLTELYYIDQN